MSIIPEDNLDVIAKLLRTWPGEPVKGETTLRVLNAQGTRPPMFWMFNAAHEPLNLAAALGVDQPLMFGRSLHLVVPTGPDRLPAALALGDHYAQVLMRVFGQMPFWAGANCQGVRSVVRASVVLREAGSQINGLCLVNGLPTSPVGLPGLLIYGADDPIHDPFTRDPEASDALARACFSRYTRAVLPNVRHGAYFNTGTVNEVAKLLHDFGDSVPEKSNAARTVERSAISG